MKLKRVSVLVLVLLLLLFCFQVVGASNVVITMYVTLAPTVDSSGATNITNNSGIVHGGITDTGGENAHTRGFEWGNSTSNYTSSWNETGSFGVGVFSYTVGNLTLGEIIYWRAFATNTIGTGYSNERSFITSLLPNAPTNFTLAQLSASSINITWTKGLGADTTPILGSSTGYPDMLDGYVVYNGTGTWVVVEDLNLSSEMYYYRAWSWNSHGYSNNYVEAQIGGNAMLGMFLGVLALGVSGLFLWKRNIVFAIGSSLSWLALGLLLLLSPGYLGLSSLADSWTQVLAFLFFIMTAGCLLWYISGIGKVKLTQTDKTGKSWTEYGKLPTEKKPSRSQQIKSTHRDRIRGIREKRR